MKFRSNNIFDNIKRSKAFTLVEVMVATTILAAILSSTLVMMNRSMTAAMDTEMKTRAFEIARENMEQLLAMNSVKEVTEEGESEIYPGIKWSTNVKPFYEPITNRMWIQATCQTSFEDFNGEIQIIKLTHWLTDLTRKQIMKIIEQQEREKKSMNPYGYSEEQMSMFAEKAGMSVEDAQAVLNDPDPDLAKEFLADMGYDEADIDDIMEEVDTTPEDTDDTDDPNPDPDPDPKMDEIWKDVDGKEWTMQELIDAELPLSELLRLFPLGKKH